MPEKSKVYFSIEQSKDHEPAALMIMPVVNGVSLSALVSDFERERSLSPAGGYGPLIPQLFDFGPLDLYLLGRQSEGSYFADVDGIYLLGCDCGEVGCWPLQCCVQETDDQIMWMNFNQPHRPERDYSEFGPFVFDAAQYREAVARLKSEFSRGMASL